MKVYNYNSEGYLIGVSELDNSDKCQITGDWLIPAQATEKEPLEKKEGFEVKFQNGDWEYIKILTDEEKKIKGELPLEEGEIIQENQLVKIEKPQDFYSWDFEKLIWFYDESLKQAKINEINKKAYQDITTIYPVWKQLNILRNKDYNLQAYEEMTVFIDRVRAYSDLDVLNL